MRRISVSAETPPSKVFTPLFFYPPTQNITGPARG
jgi:hypothetical protein